MKNIAVSTFVVAIALCSVRLWGAQTTVDEQQVLGLIEDFRSIPEQTDRNVKIGVFADDYVHITADGAMTTSWRLIENIEANPGVTIDKLHVRIFGSVAVASYRWRLSDGRTSSVAQVFQKRPEGWRIIATQVGGADPGFVGPVVPEKLVPPKNIGQIDEEVRNTWRRYVTALDLKLRR